MSAGRRTNSICLVVAEELNNRLEQDPDVQRGLPQAEILKVVLDPRFHVLEASRFSATAIDPGKSGDTGQHLVAHHIALDQSAIFLVVRHRVWSRSYKTHASLQHVEKLGQL